ncbi:MAG TPA: glutamate-1-semialdehyde 2,1-aminomutase [Syntrophorhabdaceae bacterium]|nr:glutamate-1-semialdehyde 2,1-aminomutase [Syntrophorhabdaceae bacterium]
MNREKSNHLYERAKKVIPGGVNSPVRAFKSVNDTPFYVKSADGAYLVDEDGFRYLDYVLSWGAIILGHAHPGLIEEVSKAISVGTSFGACHRYEIELAERIVEAFPSIDMVRLTSSGTEATMSAIRLARGYTGKEGIIKFIGCYHGHVDALLVKAGSGLVTFGIPDSKGIIADYAKHTYIADFNSIESVHRIIKNNKNIACVIIEPVMGNMGVILPEETFLKDLESMCRENEILLIFDEVITGFRLIYGGAQHIYNIKPDITCLGKIIGGGFPIGAFGGRKDIMDILAPTGDVYQAGTLSGNPVAVRAGIYTLDYLKKNQSIYKQMYEYSTTLEKEILDLANSYGIPYRINKITGMWTGFFADTDIHNYAGAIKSDRQLYERFFKLMLEEGIFFAPSPFEASFLSLNHKEDELIKTIDAFKKVFKRLSHG